MRRLPPLSAVRVFESAARHQNFTSAAAELGMTQAAVSYQIRLLEERLGMPLFTRSKGRVTLTDAGRRAAPLVSSGLDSIADAFSSALAEDGGVLGISATHSMAANWLAARLGGFQLDHPDLAVRLTTDNRLVDFAREEVDIGIRFVKGNSEWPGLRRHFLFRVHSTPICTPEVRDRLRIERPADLLEAPRVSADDEWWCSWFAYAGVEHQAQARPTGIRFDTQVMEGNAALAGAGVTLLTPIFWRNELQSGRLVELFPDICDTQGCYWMVYPEYKRTQAKVVAFRDWIMRELAAFRALERPEVFTPPAAD